MLPVLVVLSPLPRRHFGAAAGGVHPIITPVEHGRRSRREVAGAARAKERGRTGARTFPRQIEAAPRAAAVTSSAGAGASPNAARLVAGHCCAAGTTSMLAKASSAARIAAV